MYIGRKLPQTAMDMRKFDSLEFVRQAREYLKTLTDPRQRQIMQNYVDHAEGEMTGDYVKLMASCSRKRQSYEIYGAEVNVAMPQSYEELELFYWNLIAHNMAVLQLDLENFTVGQDTIWIQGILHHLYPGKLAETIFGIPMAEPEGVYQYTSRVAIFFLFDEDGMGAGEHSYNGSKPKAEDFVLVPPELIPARYYANPLAGMTFRPGIADEMLLAKASD